MNEKLIEERKLSKWYMLFFWLILSASFLHYAYSSFAYRGVKISETFKINDFVRITMYGSESFQSYSPILDTSRLNRNSVEYKNNVKVVPLEDRIKSLIIWNPLYYVYPDGSYVYPVLFLNVEVEWRDAWFSSYQYRKVFTFFDFTLGELPCRECSLNYKRFSYKGLFASSDHIGDFN